MVQCVVVPVAQKAVPLHFTVHILKQLAQIFATSILLCPKHLFIAVASTF